MKTYSESIGNFVENLSFKDLPIEVVNKVKTLFLDALGICATSSQKEYAKAIIELINELGGKPESTLFIYGGKAPTVNAVMINSALIHGLDFDDTHAEAIVHPSACILPTALAIGEAKGLDGKSVITAAVSGYETMIRIGLAAKGGFHDRGFHATPICGVFAAALVAGKLLDLTTFQLQHALGICGSQAAGLQEFLNDGTWVKRLHPGWAAHGGIISTLLAQKGYTGPYKVFEGRFGLFKGFFPDERKYALNQIDKDLGIKWETLGISIKPYSCCHFVHSFLDCSLYLKNKYKIKNEDIKEIQCIISERGAEIVCKPIDIKRRPDSIYGAQFSLPFTIATILLKGKLSIKEFSEENLKDPEILKLASKVNYIIDPNIRNQKYFPGHVKIEMNSGKVYEHAIKEQRGCPENPMSQEEIEKKFKENVEGIIPNDQMQEIIDKVSVLEKLENVSELTNLIIQKRRVLR